jgi:hypothetical protein
MFDDVLDKYAAKRPDGNGAANEDGRLDDLGSFGWLRGIPDWAIMLEMRHKDRRKRTLRRQ